jgi:ribosome biogenesis GTPase
VCSVRKTVAKSDLPPAVGDWVRISRIDEVNGVIEEVMKRGTSLTRMAAGPKPRPQVLLANLDLLVVVASVAEPEPNLRLIDRFLVMAEYSGIEAVIVWNKMDLICFIPPLKSPPGTGGEMKQTPPLSPPTDVVGDTYQRIGYQNILTCALTGEGVEVLRELVSGKTSMFIGASGVGKTSLLNQLQPGLAQKIAAISQATGKGTHATSTTEIFPMDENTFIADSPGVREFALWGVTKNDLASCFREFVPLIPDCQFRDCLHNQEKGCAVKKAVEEGVIERERWESYVRILRTL